MADRQKLRAIGEAWANNLFRDMHVLNGYQFKPEYQGPKFTWEDFPEMVARLAAVSAFMDFPETEKLTQEDEEFVAQVARETATILVDNRS